MGEIAIVETAADAFQTGTYRFLNRKRAQQVREQVKKHFTLRSLGVYMQVIYTLTMGQRNEGGKMRRYTQSC